MTKPNIKLTKRQIVTAVVAAACLLIYGIFTAESHAFALTQTTQQSAAKWDEDGRYAMISAFTGNESTLDAGVIARLENTLDETLSSEGVVAPAENARLYTSAYSRRADVSVSTDRAGSQSCTAYGVGGDFFRFHGYKLISGNYLSEDNIMDDFVVLDREAAWKLFGAVEVDGLELTFAGRIYTVSGVVEPEDGFLSGSGGAAGGALFFPMKAFEYAGMDCGATCYEIIFPNPVTDFALEKVTQALKSFQVTSDDAVIINNSGRYGIKASLGRIRSWFKRGMSFKEVSYPYWENSAIGVENIVDVLTVFRIIFIVPPILIAVIVVLRFHPIHRLGLAVRRLIGKLRR